MTVYDWNKVSRRSLEELAHHAHAEESEGGHLDDLREAIAAVARQALLPPLRTRAEVDAEIVSVLRESVASGRSRDCFPLVLDGSPPMRAAERLIELCAEPVAAADPDVVREPATVHGPELCGCDEALTLRARVQELEAERSNQDALHRAALRNWNRTTDDLRERLVNIYHLTLTGGEDAAAVRAIRAASSPGAPSPSPERPPNA